MSYLHILKALRGQGIVMEIGSPNRPSPEVVRGLLWDVLDSDTVALVITFKDENVEKKPAPTPPGQPVAPMTYELYREFYFKWVLVDRIITIESDANAKIHVQGRTLIVAKNDPLYTDGAPGWSTLNNALSDRIKQRLKDLNVDGFFAGVKRTEANEPLTGEDKPITNINDALGVPAMPPPSAPGVPALPTPAVVQA